jgi:hypothetical protein
MKNQKYKKNKNTKKSKNGFRRRSRKHIKGGLRSDWKERNRVQDEHGIYIIYHSELHPNIHITYRGEDNFHATPNHQFSHFGHDTLGNHGKLGFFGKKITNDEEKKNKLINAWLSFNEGYIALPVVRHEFSPGGVAVMSRTPTPRRSTDPDDYPMFVYPGLPPSNS